MSCESISSAPPLAGLKVAIRSSDLESVHLETFDDNGNQRTIVTKEHLVMDMLLVPDRI